MSYALSVFMFWIMTFLGVPECESMQGLESAGVCVEQPAKPSPPPPVERQPPGAGAVSISNGF